MHGVLVTLHKLYARELSIIYVSELSQDPYHGHTPIEINIPVSKEAVAASCLGER